MSTVQLAPLVVLRIVFFSFIILYSLAPARAQDVADGACSDYRFVQHDLEEIGYIYEPARQCFEMSLPAPGILILEVFTPPLSQVEPWIRVDESSCGTSGEKSALTPIERMPSSTLFEIRSSTVCRFSIEAQDPEKPLGEYRLFAGFVPLPGTKEGDPEEYEPDPDTWTHLPSAEGPVSTETILEWCRHRLLDDHGNSFRCASRLVPGVDVVAEIRGDGGDDDMFVIDVRDDIAILRLETTGDTDTEGALYDRRGYRLKRDDDGGTGRNFRLVKTLSRGRYYLQVTGPQGGEGRYRLGVEILRAGGGGDTSLRKGTARP